MRDLLEFLHARLAEDAAVAQQARPTFVGWLSTQSFRSRDVAPQLTYLMHWQPTRTLDDTEAKRRRVELIAAAGGMSDEARWHLLLAEAIPYHRHPEFRPEWRTAQ